MNIVIRVNNELEGYDLIDMDSDQSHDGDGAHEVIATVYSEEWAIAIRDRLNNPINSGYPRFFKC